MPLYILLCSSREQSIFSPNDEILRQYLNPLFHSFHPHVAIITTDSDSISVLTELLGKIDLCTQEKHPAYELHIVGLLNILITTLFTHFPVLFIASANHHSKLDASMRHMLSYIHQNYARPIYSEELCAAGQISRTGCFSLFKKYTGDTPSKFILKYRLALARNQLGNPDVSIAQIATNCGFTHQSHLTSHFKDYYGITPHEYRKNRNKLWTNMV